MAYRKKRKNNESKPLTLSDGTEVYEITDSFSVNSLIDISFSRSRPVRSRHQQEYQRLDGFITEEPINTETAKLNYIGCTLIPPDNEINKSINFSFNDEKNKLYQAPSRRKDTETPYVKYNRLWKELSKFAQDLSKYDTNDPVDKSNVKLLTVGIKNLNNILSAISKDEDYKKIIDKNYSKHNNVNKPLTETIEKVMNPTPSRSDDDNKDSNDMNKKDGWLLYAKNKGIKINGTSDAQFLNMESRISAMENCMGFVTDMKNPYPDTLNAVDLLESRFDYVFGVSWQTIKGRANSMMNDLKNIKYHLDLMQARYKPTEKQTRMEWEKLEDLWIMMNKWDKIVFELINIVKRLKSLQNYHYRTCKFIKRVETIYKQQCRIYQSLKTDEKTLQKCLQSMQNNTEQLNKNAMYLTQRLNVLNAKLNQ